MKAFILAAGLGTRLKPWTLEHPKALVPVGGVPMLRRVIDRLRQEGFDDITVNVHHFADQIIDYLECEDFGVDIRISDESEALLDTGGALLHAAGMLDDGESPVLVHNVDILSNAGLAGIMLHHAGIEQDITLVTSPRQSSRKLVFDHSDDLRGWHNVVSGEYRPDGFAPDANMHENAFSGIYVFGPKVFSELRKYADAIRNVRFSVMDFLLWNAAKDYGGFDRLSIHELMIPNLKLIDIGKPDTLTKADSFFL